MNKLLKNFLRPKKFVGVDIGTSSLKFVQLREEDGSFKLESFGLLDADLFSDNAVPLQRAAQFVKESKIAGSQVALNIEDKSLKIRRMDLPDMPPADLKIAIRWNYREYVDGPIEKFLVDFTKIEAVKGEEEKNAYVAYAVSMESAEKLQKIAKHLGLKPATIEPNATALLSAFDQNVSWEQGKFYAVIDFGCKIANFIVLGNKCLLFSRPMNAAGYYNLIKSVSKAFGENEELAGARVRKFVKDPATVDGVEKLKELVASYLSDLVVEVQRSIDAFCIMFKADKVDEIYICGGGTSIGGVADYFAKNLGVESRIFDPFTKVDTSLVGKEIANPQLYTVALGLALPRD